MWWGGCGVVRAWVGVGLVLWIVRWVRGGCGLGRLWFGEGVLGRVWVEEGGGVVGMIVWWVIWVHGVFGRVWGCGGEGVDYGGIYICVWFG